MSAVSSAKPAAPASAATISKEQEATVKENIKVLQAMQTHFDLLSKVKWNSENAALLEKFVKQMTPLMNASPLYSVLDHFEYFDTVPKAFFDLWEQGNKAQSTQLMRKFLEGETSATKPKWFFSNKWSQKNFPSEFVSHFLESLPDSIVDIDISIFFHSAKDEHIDIVIKRFPHLQKLKIGSTDITSASLIKIAGSMRNLTELELGGCHSVTKEGVLAIVQKSTLPQLKNLCLGHLWQNKCVDDEVLGHLAQNPHFGNLDTINIASSSVTAKGLLALAKSPFLKKLKKIWIHISEVQIDAATKQALVKFSFN